MDPLDAAIRKIRSGQFSQALVALEQLIGNKDYELAATGHRAWLYRSLGQYGAAIHDFERLMRLNPDDLHAAGLLAETRLLAGDTERAVEEALNLLRRDPLNQRAAAVVIQYQKSRGVESISTPPEPADAGNSNFFEMNRVIESLENDPLHFRASVWPEIGRLLYILVRCLRPKLMIEAGSFIGYSALCISQAMRENGQGHLHSFDLFLDRPDYISPVLGACPDMLRVARGHLEQAGLSGQVTFHQGDSSQKIKEALGDLRAGFDLAFIDGDHRIRGCLKDWQAVDPLIAEGGIILLHDTQAPASGWLGPRHLLEKLDAEARENYSWINLPTIDGNGLALIQKRSAGHAGAWRPSFSELLTEYLFNRSAGWHKGK